jgi:hypothetical protein
MQALEYGDDVLKSKPGDMNILQEIAGIYSIKLGAHPTRPEQKFYNRQLCEESMTDSNRKLAYPDDTNFSRLWQSTRILDDHNNILPEFLAPTRPRPADVTGDWNDGSTLQYLAKFEPFPQGVSPAAMAYNYAKRSQVAVSVDGQKPLQVSAMVIDSRPAIELEQWTQESTDQGRLAEAHAFGVSVPDDESPEHDADLAAISPTATPADSRAFDTAVGQYALAGTLARDAYDELTRHLKNPAYAQRFTLYASHLDDMQEAFFLRSADRDYLTARNLSGEPARQLRQQAIAEYRHGVALAERIVLKYYTDEEVLRGTFPSNITKESLPSLPDGLIVALFERSMAISNRLPASQFDDDRVIYLREITRGLSRIKQLSALH